MALFEGTVAFVMISASMKSMDPALEESARVMGASKLRTMLTVTLPLVMPGVLGATLFVFAEMLGSFAAALVLGIPGRIYVITTAIWDSTLAYPPDYGRASAMGLSLFVVMFGMLTFYRRVIGRGSFTTISGKAFRPRPMDMGRMAWVLFSVCPLYVALAVVLPIAALLLTSLQRFATVILSQAQWTLANYETALSLGPVRTAMVNSLMLGFGVASVGVVIMALLVWIIYRSQLAGRGAHRISRDVPAGRAAPGLRPRAAVGLAQHPDPDLRHPVAAGARLFHRDAAARRAHAGGRGAADRQEPGGMRPRLRRRLGLPDAHRHLAAAESPASWRRGC